MFPNTLDDVLFELRALHFTILAIKSEELGMIDEKYLKEYIKENAERLSKSYVQSDISE